MTIEEAAKRSGMTDADVKWLDRMRTKSRAARGEHAPAERPPGLTAREFYSPKSRKRRR